MTEALCIVAGDSPAPSAPYFFIMDPIRQPSQPAPVSLPTPAFHGGPAYLPLQPAPAVTVQLQAGEDIVTAGIAFPAEPSVPLQAVSAAPPAAASEASGLETLPSHLLQDIATLVEPCDLSALSRTSRAMRHVAAPPLARLRESRNRLSLWAHAGRPEMFFAELNSIPHHPWRFSLLLTLPMLSHSERKAFIKPGEPDRRQQIGRLAQLSTAERETLLVHDLLTIRTDVATSLKCSLEILPIVAEGDRWPLLEAALRNDYVQTDELSALELDSAALSLPKTHRAPFLFALMESAVGNGVYDHRTPAEILAFLRRVAANCGLAVVITYTGHPRVKKPNPKYPLADCPGLIRAVAARLACFRKPASLTPPQRANRTELYRVVAEALVRQGEEGVKPLIALCSAYWPTEDSQQRVLMALLRTLNGIADAADRLDLVLTLSEAIPPDPGHDAARSTLLRESLGYLPTVQTWELARYLIGMGHVSDRDGYVKCVNDLAPLFGEPCESGLLPAERAVFYQSLLRRLSQLQIQFDIGDRTHPNNALMNVVLRDTLAMDMSVGSKRLPVLKRFMLDASDDMTRLFQLRATMRAHLFPWEIEVLNADAAVAIRAAAVCYARPEDIAALLGLLDPVADPDLVVALLECFMRLGWPADDMPTWMDLATRLPPPQRAHAIELAAQYVRRQSPERIHTCDWFTRQPSESNRAGPAQIDIPVSAMHGVVDRILIGAIRFEMAGSTAIAQIPARTGSVISPFAAALERLRGLARRMKPIAGEPPVAELIARRVRMYHDALAPTIVSDLLTMFAEETPPLDGDRTPRHGSRHTF